MASKGNAEVLRAGAAIAGGGLGACAAALAAARLGHRARPPACRLPRTQARLNPGNGWVSRLCRGPAARSGGAEPDDGLAAAEREAVRAGTAPAAGAWTDGDRVVVPGIESGRDPLIVAPYGDLLALAGVEHVAGAESRSEAGEPHARDQPDQSGR